ncbi:ead/Ea22-like family protein [Cedecea neteri]|uniref:ead/Ea22-like family protein n=1 Tax=Cedecea neteri TaxID=158822 RepID=UPI002892F6F4|nr:ead/Ea22-like family protein [Cedecea neteri]WNJ77804.1 ead/Ea22-like family protein [Cedecea neteri]
MTVKRYEAMHRDVWDDESGKFVRYEDYAELQRQLTAYESTVTNLTEKVQGLVVENARIKSAIPNLKDVDYGNDSMDDVSLAEDVGFNDAVTLMNRWMPETPSTDAALAEIRNETRAEGIFFTANRMLAAWDAGFIDSPAKEVIDVARMILSAADMLKDATQADFSRKFADEIMAEMAPELRKEQGK